MRMYVYCLHTHVQTYMYMWNFICLPAYTYVYECMHVSVFIGNNARKYASQLPSHLKTYTYIQICIVCVCVRISSITMFVPRTVLLKSIFRFIDRYSNEF